MDRMDMALKWITALDSGMDQSNGLAEALWDERNVYPFVEVVNETEREQKR